jgi:hypothetical protein
MYYSDVFIMPRISSYFATGGRIEEVFGGVPIALVIFMFSLFWVFLTFLAAVVIES